MDITVLAVTAAYFIVSLGLGFWVARKEKNVADDYFLAGRKLPWYAISMSMTGANIGTEHFIGMVGTAYAVGLAPATFEWGNFIPYSILAWIFLPFFYRKRLYTIPEFLERRYSPATRSVFALFSLFHMVMVVLAPALYAGGRIIYEMTLQRPVESFNSFFIGGILMISAATAAYCIYGGLLSVVWTDVLQVVILVLGGALLLFIGLHNAGGFHKVIETNLAYDASRFSLIQSANHPVSPWPGVATFWLTLSLWYVGANQFYIQRCLGAKSEWDAKMGVIGCAYIKLILPSIIVFPGLVAFAKFGPGLKEDAVYVKMINEFLPPVGKGILLAALIAAIMSTVSCVLNSASTIWSMDIYKRYCRPNATDAELVSTGRWSTFIVILIGTAFAPLLLMWEGGIFIYIQDMAAFLAPPVTVIFLAAFLWRKAHGRAAAFTLIFGIFSGVCLKIFAETWGTQGVAQLKPLLNRAAVNWAICLAALTLATYLIPKNAQEMYDPDAIWNAQWGRLPESERVMNRGRRNLMLWWAVMVASSASLFIIFK
ncbi:MAG: sodium/solute symporter [Candidatus Omnitrophota bacterium]